MAKNSSNMNASDKNAYGKNIADKNSSNKTDIIRMHPKRMHMGSPTRMNPIEILLTATATATKRDSNQKMA